MKTKLFWILTLPLLMLFSCQKKETNPFFSEYNTPFGVPPFDQIKNEHFMPAIKEGIKQHQAEIDAIANNTEAPTFANTIEALEYSGDLLSRTLQVFYNFNSCLISDSIQDIAREMSPMLSEHFDNVSLNPKIFERVKTLYEQRESLNLDGEQKRLLEEKYKGFVRSGAALDAEKQKRLREINQELSMLSLKFGENVLAETNNYSLVIEKEADLAGLPKAVIDAAAETAKAAGKEGKWMFTLQNPSVMPFLSYADNRELRKEINMAYINRGNNNNEFDNKDIIKKIVEYRIERSKILGYPSFAHYTLEETMAKTPENVFDLMNQLWKPALDMAAKEAGMLQDMIKKEGKDFQLEAWDWRYYAEKVKKDKYNYDETELQPYFELENVKQGVFTLVNKLYGLTFEARTDIPKYHKDAVVYEVKEADGKHLGILYLDFHPRASKRPGAWMSSYRDQHINKEGKYITPVITVVCNFTAPTGNEPALLTYDEVETFFHEFGHALHGLFANSKYPSLAGTNVTRDFVELPSQIMENWVPEPEVMAFFAKHYKTGEVIPQELLDKMEAVGKFNMGFATVEFLASALLDMEYHLLSDMSSFTNAVEFEDQFRAKNEVTPQIPCRHRSTYFQHVFSGGYSAGYYSYIWSEILDSDAYEAFKETSLFDQTTAQAFRKNILERGNTEDPMDLYKKFRGREPKIEPLLVKRGLK
ncbi:MAG: M3 family metallopeptidase [Bacteroidales bacterium]|nr:M3 family metallopeptidase [Bacteroidales bacterium]